MPDLQFPEQSRAEAGNVPKPLGRATEHQLAQAPDARCGSVRRSSSSAVTLLPVIKRRAIRPPITAGLHGVIAIRGPRGPAAAAPEPPTQVAEAEATQAAVVADTEAAVTANRDFVFDL